MECACMSKCAFGPRGWSNVNVNGVEPWGCQKCVIPTVALTGTARTTCFFMQSELVCGKVWLSILMVYTESEVNIGILRGPKVKGMQGDQNEEEEEAKTKTRLSEPVPYEIMPILTKTCFGTPDRTGSRGQVQMASPTSHTLPLVVLMPPLTASGVLLSAKR